MVPNHTVQLLAQLHREELLAEAARARLAAQACPPRSAAPRAEVAVDSVRSVLARVPSAIAALAALAFGGSRAS